MKTSKFQQRLLNTINLHLYDEEGEEEEEEEEEEEDVEEDEEDHPTDQQPGPVPTSHERTPPAAHKTPTPNVRLQARPAAAPRVPPEAKLPSAVGHHPRRPGSASSAGPPPVKRQRIEGLPTPAPATGARPPPPWPALPFGTPPPRAAMPAPLHPPAGGAPPVPVWLAPAPPSTASAAGAVINPSRDPRLRSPGVTDLPPTTTEAGRSSSLLDLPQSVTVIQDHPCRHVLLSGVDGRTKANRDFLESKCQNALVPDLIWNEFYTRRGDWKGEWALLCCENETKSQELKDKLQGTKMARRTLRASFMAHIDALRRDGPSDKLILFNVPLEYSLDELQRLLNATRVHRMSLGRPSRQAEKGAIRKQLEVMATFISPEAATRARGLNGDIMLSTGHVVHASYFPLLEP